MRGVKLCVKEVKRGASLSASFSLNLRRTNSRDAKIKKRLDAVETLQAGSTLNALLRRLSDGNLKGVFVARANERADDFAFAIDDKRCRNAANLSAFHELAVV